MSLKDKITKLKSKINDRAEEITKNQEDAAYKQGIAEQKRWLLKEFDGHPDGILKVYGAEYVQIKSPDKDEIAGYEVYKNGYKGFDENDLPIFDYERVYKEDGNGLFSIDELAEYSYRGSQGSEDFLFDTIAKTQMHEEKVQKNKRTARKEVLGEIIKNRLGRNS